MVFGIVLSLVLGLAAVLLEPYFLPGICTGFLMKIGVYRVLILPPIPGIVPEILPEILPGILPGYCRGTAGILFLVQTAFHIPRFPV